MPKLVRNWDEVQNYLDDCGRIDKTLEKFSMSRTAFNTAVKDGKLLKNVKPRHHSLETRKKLSEIRISFLKENPEKHPWRYKEKFKSKPCEYLKSFLKDSGIAFEEEFNDFDRGYSIDIAFPQSKVAIEVNGNQHYNNDGSLKDYYEKRDLYFKSLGWRTLQVPCRCVYDNNCRNDILKFVLENVDVNLKYIPKHTESKVSYKDILNAKNVFRMYKILKSDVDFTKWGALSLMAKELDITPQHLSRWLKIYAPSIYNSIKH